MDDFDKEKATTPPLPNVVVAQFPFKRVKLFQDIAKELPPELPPLQIKILGGEGQDVTEFVHSITGQLNSVAVAEQPNNDPVSFKVEPGKLGIAIRTLSPISLSEFWTRVHNYDENSD